jgi:hypothetical protein
MHMTHMRPDDRLSAHTIEPRPKPAKARCGRGPLALSTHLPSILCARPGSTRILPWLTALLLLGFTTTCRAEHAADNPPSGREISQGMTAEAPSPPLGQDIHLADAPGRWFRMESPWIHATMLMAYVLFLAFFFAKVEIHIEGPHGWAQALPTWRVEKHPLLDIFWGSRPLTGYHAWVFAFMALSFHLTIFVTGKFGLKQEARILGCLMIFWIAEDFLWFVMNPAYGIRKFRRDLVWWHKKWLLGVPSDYITFTIAGTVLFIWSFR